MKVDVQQHGSVLVIVPRGAITDGEIEDLQRTLGADGARGGGSRQVEFGMALALGKTVIVVGPMEHLFHRLPEVQVVETWKDAVSFIVSLSALGSFPAPL